MNRIASVPRSLLAMFALWIAMPVLALAQSLPVSVDVAGKVASVQVGTPGNPIADITLTFDDVSGLSAASLGISAQTINVSDPALLARLPSSLASIPSAFPVMVTIEPPAAGGLVQRRLTHVEVHTHALPYTAGTPLRLFKAPLGGRFRDITEDVLPGSVRTRGTTPGWSQFIVVADLRPSANVIVAKYSYLRTQAAVLPDVEKAPLLALLDASEAALGNGDFATASAKLEEFRARVSQRAGTTIPDVWKATRDVTNTAGELLAGADTLAFSIGYLRDFGH
jgi:hypothetical protein